MSPYVLPALIAAACAAGATAAAVRTRRPRTERRAAELRDEEFTTALTGIGADVPAPRIPRQDPAMAVPTAAEATRPAPAPDATGPMPDAAAEPAAAEPAPAPTAPQPSHGLAPMLPAHLTGAHLLGVAERGTPVIGLRSGTAGGLDVFDFADGGSIVVMPADREVAARVGAALEQGREVRLLGTSEVGGGRSLTLLVHESTAYFLADRVYARPAA